MAVLFVDSYAHYTNPATKYDTVSGGGINLTAGRHGGNPAGTGAVVKNLGVNAPTVIIGHAYRYPLAQTETLLSLGDGVTTQVFLRVNSDGSLSAFRQGNGTPLGTTAPGKFVFGTAWNAIGFHATIHDTAGVIKVWCNDPVGSPSLNLTGIDTQASATNAYANQFANGPSGFGGFANDLYILDSTGAANNSYLGDCRVQYRAPTADGAVSQSTPNNGTTPVATRWGGVTETAPTNDDNYNTFATGNRDEYALQDLTATSGSVYAVCPVALARKDDAGANSVRIGVVSGASTGETGDLALNTTYRVLQGVIETDPNTAAAWTIAAVNAASGMFRRTV